MIGSYSDHIQIISGQGGFDGFLHVFQDPDLRLIFDF